MTFPLQFCSNDPETFLKAAQLVEPYCDGVDLNLGCPQIIAKRGMYRENTVKLKLNSNYQVNVSFGQSTRVGHKSTEVVA